MKAFSMSVFFGLLCAAGSAAAASGSLSQFPTKVVPVLVQVDAHGKITDASPAVRLSPTLTRLLNQNLDEMITAPAKVHGKSVSSQFVINLRLSATPKEKGDYDVQFAYVSMSPVPSGSWYWVNQDNRRLALARQGSMHFPPVYHEPRFNPPNLNRSPVSTPPPTNPPAQHNTAHSSHSSASSR